MIDTYEREQMKVQWEKNDLRVGRVVGRVTSRERWVIGYNPADDARALVSLDDGMIMSYTIDEMLNRLNDGQFLPKEILP